MDMLNQLPIEWIPPADLPKVVSDTSKSHPSGLEDFLDVERFCISGPNLGQIYAAQLELPDYLVHEGGAAFDRSEYNSHPSSFTSAFHEKVSFLTYLFLCGCLALELTIAPDRAVCNGLS